MGATARRLEASAGAAGLEAPRLRCLNCGAGLAGPYCAECGQRDTEPRPRLHELARELSAELSSVDGKLVKTLRTLMVDPGGLSVAFCRGRRAAYLSPLRLYLLCSAFFFLVMAVTPAVTPLAAKRPAAQATPVHRDRPADNALGRWIFAHRGQSLARAKADPVGLARSRAAAMPQLIFALVPFMALVFAVAFHQRGIHYPEHLVFTLHVHAFAFFLFAIRLLDGFARNESEYILLTFASGILVFTYAVTAAHRMYRRSVLSSAIRVAAVVLTYVACTAISMGFVSAMVEAFY